MASQSNIEWTDATWNPIVGCSVVSPGCTNCYAMSMAARINRMTLSSHYEGLTKEVNGNQVWTGKIARANDHIFRAPLRWRKPKRIFVNSMGDLFHESIPDEWIERAFAVMALAPQHTFQVLTKRAERMREWFANVDRADHVGLAMLTLVDRIPYGHRRVPWPLVNVWLGVSAERQQEADERIPDLLATPAAVRFVSLEPLLGLIDLMVLKSGERIFDALQGCHGWRDGDSWEHGGACAKLDWVIVGGESGSKARPMHPEWARLLQIQCDANGVPFFFKQWGGWSPVYDRDVDDPDWRRCDVIERETPDGQWLNLAGGQGFHGERIVRVDRIGKKAAGRLLDGVTHDGYPQ